jgi:hypothetical protein
VIEIGYGNSQCKRYVTWLPKPRTRCRKPVKSITIRPHQNTRGGNNVEFGKCIAAAS